MKKLWWLIGLLLIGLVMACGGGSGDGNGGSDDEWRVPSPAPTPTIVRTPGHMTQASGDRRK